MVITGRVQGVGFRDFAQHAAMREGVTGWVRNRPDGRVEAYVEGEDASVERVERALRAGPPHAHVDDVDAIEEDAVGALKGFSIR